MPGLKPLFRNSLSAEGAKAVTIKAWAPKARMLMHDSGRYVRLCIRLTIPILFKVYMYLFLRFFCLKFSKVLKQNRFLWIKWIMERCYPNLWWYFCCSSFIMFSLFRTGSPNKGPFRERKKWFLSGPYFLFKVLITLLLVSEKFPRRWQKSEHEG